MSCPQVFTLACKGDDLINRTRRLIFFYHCLFYIFNEASVSGDTTTTSGAKPLNGNLPKTAPAPATNILLNTLGYTITGFIATKAMLSIGSTLYIYLI